MMLYLDLFLTFFKIGAFTFGGGYAMLPLVQQEVMAHRWMTSAELINFIAVSESTPGPFAVNMSTYVGSVTGGFFGAVCATLGVILPSFLIILLIAKAYKKFADSCIVKGVMSGLRPAVVGMIGASVISVGTNVFFGADIPWLYLKQIGAALGSDRGVLGIINGAAHTSVFWVSMTIFVLALLLRLWKKIHPIKIILLSALLGIAAGYAGLI